MFSQAWRCGLDTTERDHWAKSRMTSVGDFVMLRSNAQRLH